MEKCKHCGYEIISVEAYESDPLSCRKNLCTGIQTWDTDPFQEEVRGDTSLYLQCPGERRQSACEI